jgi:1-aminocyclopropane-1-carboxylate deaminase/D-cysteine desulfhydrase-like pyridoxal-dependent ACC family enzyme
MPASTSASATPGSRRWPRSKPAAVRPTPSRPEQRAPLGGLGFANWAFEVAEQEKQLGIFFGTIIVCTVTGSTCRMIAGFAALEEATGVAVACSGSMRRRPSEDA